MTSTTNKADVLVLGVHTRADAYPHITYRLADLAADGSLSVREINVPYLNAQQGGAWQRSGSGKVLVLLRFTLAHIRVIFRWLLARRPAVIYLPYPGVPLIWLLSFVPRRFRPPTVLDAFVSIYDTAVLDRKLFAENGLVARLIRTIEARAFRAADLIVVDTRSNAEHYQLVFNLPVEMFLTINLSIDENIFCPQPYTPRNGRCEVLFLGTMVPLHGITTILDAALLLRETESVKFRLIGSGQQSGIVERFLREHELQNVSWTREWQPSEALQKQIAEADICLGIFAEGDKTDRVWPLKNYLYMAVGRTVVSGATREAVSILSAGDHPVHVVPRGNAAALAEKIVELANSPDERKRCAKEARRVYEQKLSRKSATGKLSDALLKLAVRDAR